jgi:hypothetical protein
MKQIDDSKVVTKTAELEKAFKDERDNWDNKVTELVSSIRYNDRFTAAMVLGLSYRQQIVDQITQYKQVSAKRRSNIDKLRVMRYREYMIEGDLKLSASEKNDAVNADLTAYTYQLSIIENQIEFLRETLKTLTDFQYTIKNKLEIIKEELM